MEALRALTGSGFEYLALLFIRVTGMILSSPIYGRQNIPALAKVALCLALTWFFYKTVPQIAVVNTQSVWVLLALMVGELLIGLIMGMLLTMLFSAVFTAGQLIDMQLGFGMANVYDPQFGTSIPLVGNFLNVMLLVLFFGCDGHLRLITMLYTTLIRIPVGTVAPVREIAITFAELFSNAFVLGIRMAMPLIVAGMLLEAIMGMIIRTVPQMNVFAIGLPLKVIVGFLIMLMVVPVFAQMTGEIFSELFNGIDTLFTGLMAA